MPDQLRALLPADGAQQLLAPDGSLSVEILRPPAEPPSARQPVEGLLGDQVQVVGYDLVSPAIQAGQPLDLLLHWRVVTNPDPRRQWTWFVHLVDSRGYRWANWSDQGVEVADWRPGDHIVQYVSLEIPFDAPDVAYHLEIGVFDRGSEERLLTADGADHVAVEGVRVLPAEPGFGCRNHCRTPARAAGRGAGLLGYDLQRQAGEAPVRKSWSPWPGRHLRLSQKIMSFICN